MHQLYPWLGSVWDPKTLTPQVYDVPTSRGIPAVGKALRLFGVIGTCDLMRVRGTTPIQPAGIVERPDPDMGPSLFVSVHVQDYLMDGNALHLVTVRDNTGYPAAVRWFPSTAWGVTDRDGAPEYWLHGRRVRSEDVIHVRRDVIDPFMPWRGIGVVEQHLRSLQRVGLEEQAESQNMQNRGRPDVVVTVPSSEPDPVKLDDAADKWVERFAGPDPKPVFLPNGSVVTPLSWNPQQGQLAELRALSNRDVANMFGLDGSWLNADSSSLTYKSPGPLFLQLHKVSFRPIMRAFEEEWSWRWTPRGQAVRFDLSELLRDDLLSMVQAYAAGSALFPGPDGINEFRRLMGLPEIEVPEPPPPPAPMLPPPAPPADTPPADTPPIPEEIPA